MSPRVYMVAKSWDTQTECVLESSLGRRNDPDTGGRGWPTRDAMRPRDRNHAHVCVLSDDLAGNLSACKVTPDDRQHRALRAVI